MAFDFKKSLIKVQGNRDYLPVPQRVVWFREEHPDWGIVTEPLEINHEKQYAVFRATIFNAEGKVMATGTKKEDVKGFGDYIEKSETSAIGRALALCGYGTQFSPDLDETGPSSRYADSPHGSGQQDAGRNGGYSRPAPPPMRPVQREEVLPAAQQEPSTEASECRELGRAIAAMRKEAFPADDTGNKRWAAFLQDNVQAASLNDIKTDLGKLKKVHAALLPVIEEVRTKPADEEDPFTAEALAKTNPQFSMDK